MSLGRELLNDYAYELNNPSYKIESARYISFGDSIYCSKCGKGFTKLLSIRNYCPHCGVKWQNEQRFYNWD